MGWDITGYRILFGLPHDEGHKRLNRIAAWRWNRIKSKQVPATGDYCYDGGRTMTANVADRFVGNHWRKFVCDCDSLRFDGVRGFARFCWRWVAIAIGRKDAALTHWWHERAGAEHWYRYEKEY